jgi:DamX protein
LEWEFFELAIMSTNHFRAIVKRLQVKDNLVTGDDALELVEPEVLDRVSGSSSYFYAGAQRQHNLETIRHLAVFGDLILLLTGVAGKSTLLSQVEQDLDGDVHVVMVRPDASQRTDSHGLVKLIAHQSAIFESASESKESLVARVVASYGSLREQTGKRTLLVVDDADRCNESDLSLLVSAIESQSSDSPVVLLFSGQPSFAEVAVGLSDKGRDIFHQVHLKSLTQEELLDYVQGGLSAEGYRGRVQLDEYSLHRLYERSKGIPKLIDVAIASILFGTGPSGQAAPKVGSGQMPARILMSIVAVLILSFLFVGYQHKLFVGMFEDSAVEQVAEHSAEQEGVADGASESASSREARLALLDKALEQSKKFEAETLVDVLDASESEQQVTEVNQAIDKDLDPSLSKGAASDSESDSSGVSEFLAPRLSQNNEESKKASVAGLDDRNLTVGDVGLAPEQVSESVTTSIATTTNAPIEGENVGRESIVSDSSLSQTPAVVVQSNVSNDEDVKRVSITKAKPVHYAYRDKAWLGSQPNDYFTMQVLGSYSESTARSFIERSGLPSLIYVQSVYKGQPWYVVLYGNFETKSQATKAKADLPNVIAKEKPWIRSFSGLQ